MARTVKGKSKGSTTAKPKPNPRPKLKPTDLEKCGKCKYKKQALATGKIGELVAKAVRGIESKMCDQKHPLAVGDYLKVMQLQKDIEEELPKEVKVSWVDSEPKTKSESEESSTAPSNPSESSTP